MTDHTPTTRLQQLIHRTDRVLAGMHAQTAAHARLMELAGAEVAFVGTSGVVGIYTGLADVGAATMTECLTLAGWIAQGVINILRMFPPAPQGSQPRDQRHHRIERQRDCTGRKCHQPQPAHPAERVQQGVDVHTEDAARVRCSLIHGAAAGCGDGSGSDHAHDRERRPQEEDDSNAELTWS